MKKEKRKVTIVTSKDRNNKTLGSVKIGRNELCKCGSGKKAKKCCGNLTDYYSIKIRERAKVEPEITDQCES
jgi:hypothetical protein